MPTHTFVHVKHGLEKPDYFLVTGVGFRKDASRFVVCGHAQLFTYNLNSNAFEGSSNM